MQKIHNAGAHRHTKNPLRQQTRTHRAHPTQSPLSRRTLHNKIAGHTPVRTRSRHRTRLSRRRRPISHNLTETLIHRRGRTTQKSRHLTARLTNTSRTLRKVHRLRKKRRHMRQQGTNLTAAAAIHNRQHANLRVGTLRQTHTLHARQLGNTRIQVSATTRRSERLITAQRRQNTWLNLRAIRHRQHLTLRRLHRLTNLRRKLQRTTAGSAPAPGRGSTHLKMRAERTLRNPSISPRPAVSSPNTVQLLITQNRVNQRPTLLPLSRNRIRPTLQLPRTRRLHRNPRRLQSTQKILRRIRVQRRHKQHALNLLRQLLHLLRTLPRHRTRTQQLAQMLMMRLHIKRDAVITNLSGHQRTGRLSRRQKTQPLRVPRLANSARLCQPLTHQHTHHRMLRQQSHRARRQLRGKRLMRCRLKEIGGGIGGGLGGADRSRGGIRSSRRTQKISAEQLLLTLNLPRHRQIPLRIGRLTHIRKIQHRAVLHKTARMRSGSRQNSLHQTQIMA